MRQKCAVFALCFVHLRKPEMGPPLGRPIPRVSHISRKCMVIEYNDLVGGLLVCLLGIATWCNNLALNCYVKMGLGLLLGNASLVYCVRVQLCNCIVKHEWCNRHPVLGPRPPVRGVLAPWASCIATVNKPLYCCPRQCVAEAIKYPWP